MSMFLSFQVVTWSCCVAVSVMKQAFLVTFGKTKVTEEIYKFGGYPRFYSING